MAHCCEDMVYYLEDEDHILEYHPVFDEYGIPVHDGENGSASSYILINHCPWCGKKLPESKSDLWFDTLEKMGFDEPFGNENIPQEFKSDQWRKKICADQKGG